MSNQIQLRERASYFYYARSWRQQTNPSRKKFSPQFFTFTSGWKCYKTIGSYVSCAFIEIWGTWEVWRALKKLELLLRIFRALQTSSVLHISMNARWRMNQLLIRATTITIPLAWFQLPAEKLKKFDGLQYNHMEIHRKLSSQLLGEEAIDHGVDANISVCFSICFALDIYCQSSNDPLTPKI